MKEIMKVKEVAQELGITQNYLYSIVAKNEIEHLRMGRVIRIRKEAVEQYIQRVTKKAV